MARPAPRRARDRLPLHAGADARFLRRAAAGRPRRDARRDDPPRRRPAAAQSFGAGRSDRRSLGDGGRFRHSGRRGAQPGAGAAAQCRALRLPALGRSGVREPAHRAAGQGHLPPGESRISGARRVDRRARRPAHRLSRFRPRHGQPHRDDQQPRHPRLGRRRTRGWGRRARRVGGDARPRRRRRAPGRQARARRDRDRPRAHRDADAAPAQGRRQVRRVLWSRCRRALASGPRDHRQHEPGERRHDGLLPGRRRNAALSPAHGPRRGAGRAGGGLLQGAGPVARREYAAPRVQRNPRD